MIIKNCGFFCVYILRVFLAHGLLAEGRRAGPPAGLTGPLRRPAAQRVVRVTFVPHSTVHQSVETRTNVYKTLQNW